MKMVSKLSFIALAILLAGCNEKVSPELQEGNSTTPTTPSTPVAPNEYYFGIVNSSDTLLNYKLHKTGAGNATAKCEVRSTTELSSDIFRGNPAANDITCYFDAEELSLYHSGFKFNITASKNTCDFVGYTPYGYYNRIPGDSGATYYSVACGSEKTGPVHIQQAAADLGINLQDANGDLNCNDWVIDDNPLNPRSIPAATRLSFTPVDEASLCRFNYKDGDKEKCDIGIITINEVQVIYNEATDTEPASVTSQIVPREIDCGGKIYNCVKGPTKELDSAAARFTEITSSPINVDFEKEYSYEKLIGTNNGIFEYANYRRNLANSNIDFNTSFGTSGTYRSVWADPIFGSIFEPRVMDYFSSNLMLNDVDPLIEIDPSDPTSRLELEARRNNTWYAKPLAADPFLGLSSKVNPFYTFYCFDTAFDMKARIRMVVRDWDRIFPTNTGLELLSDLNSFSSARQDAPGLVEIPGDNDSYTRFNDLTDWDDFVSMDRTPGSFDPNATIWSPTGTFTYPDGWFNPAIFPNVSKEDD